jgi:hypothetical protein
MKKLFALIVAVALVLMLAAVPAVADSSKLIDIYPEGSGDGGPQQLNSGGPIAVVFTVPEGFYAYEVIGLNSPTWTQTSGCDAAVEVYKWVDDYDESVDGELLAYGEVLEHQDNKDAVFSLNKDLPAGQYIAEFSAIGGGAFGFWSFGEAGADDLAFQNGAEAAFYPKTAIRVAPEGEAHAPVDPPSIVIGSAYSKSYSLNKGNAKTWTNGDIGDISVTYYLKIAGDTLNVGVVAKGVNEGDMIQLDFNPDNKLAGVPGLFISFKLGDKLTVLQHNHKTALLDDDSAAGADISDKVETEIVKMSAGYEFTAKLPADLFKITDVDGLDSFEFGADPLYFGMFIVTGSHGYTNQSAAPGADWTCGGLGLTEYSITDPYRDKTVQYLYDPSNGVTTGWWLHPVSEDTGVSVEFTTDKWFKGIDFFAYSCDFEIPMVAILEDANGNEVYSTEFKCVGNKSYSIDFGTTFGPDTYVLSFVGGDMSEIEDDNWFVLGSAPANDTIDEVTVVGGATNDSTKEAPFISLKLGEADPNATAKPTKEPATPAPTEAPTAEPTDAPEPTTAPTEKNAAVEEDATKAPEDENQKSSGVKPGLIIGIAAAGVVLVGAIVTIIVASKKKK